MDQERVRKVCYWYLKRFEVEEIPKVEMPLDKSPTKKEMLAYAHYLIANIQLLTKNPDNRIGKMHRDLGFAQAILVIAGWLTSEEVKMHNKPDT